MWFSVFKKLVTAKYDLLGVLKQENYIKDHKEHILTGFFHGFEELDQGQKLDYYLESFIQNPKDQKVFTYKIPFSKETLFNLFLYCEFPKDHSETLMNHFFREKSYEKILLYYKNMIFSLFKVDLKSIPKQSFIRGN